MKTGPKLGSTRVDETGKIFGKLIAIKPLYRDANKKWVWEFKCECGNIISKPMALVKKSDRANCGCVPIKLGPSHRRKDLTGKVFGMLTALEPAGHTKDSKMLWKFKCECGNTKISKPLDILRIKGIASCGCMSTENIAAAQRRDLSGQVFNRWTVLEPDKTKHNQGAYWIYKCVCGTIRSEATSALVRSLTKSCGCWRSEYASAWIKANGHKFKRPTGKDHFWYNPQLTDEDRKSRRTSKFNTEWRNDVLFRDDCTCQRCSVQEGELHAHHIIPWSSNKDLRFDVNNGITLCASCHFKYHGQYRILDVSSETLQQFKSQYVGKL